MLTVKTTSVHWAALHFSFGVKFLQILTHAKSIRGICNFRPVTLFSGGKPGLQLQKEPLGVSDRL